MTEPDFAPVMVRQARPGDVRGIEEADLVARVDRDRRRFIRHSVAEGAAYVAVFGGVAAGAVATGGAASGGAGAAGSESTTTEGAVVGYLVLEHGFFGRGFISMLAVHPDHRRAGVATALVHHAERACRSDRLFTSTNQSNLVMQALLDRLGYVRSGIVDHLDPGDPELIYSRLLPGRRASGDGPGGAVRGGG